MGEQDPGNAVEPQHDPKDVQAGVQRQSPRRLRPCSCQTGLPWGVMSKHNTEDFPRAGYHEDQI